MTDPGRAYPSVENLINICKVLLFDFRRLGNASIVATVTVRAVARNVRMPLDEK